MKKKERDEKEKGEKRWVKTESAIKWWTRRKINGKKEWEVDRNRKMKKKKDRGESKKQSSGNSERQRGGEQ